MTKGYLFFMTKTRDGGKTNDKYENVQKEINTFLHIDCATQTCENVL